MSGLRILKNQAKIFKYELQNDTRGAQNIGFAVWLKGELDYKRLSETLSRIHKEHDALCMSFGIAEDGYIIHKENKMVDGFKTHDFTRYKADIRMEKVFSEIRKWNAKPIDIFNENLYEFHLYQLSSDEHILFIKANHLLSDGPSIRAIYGKLASYYSGQEVVSSGSWSDFIQERQNYEESIRGKEDGKYWEDLIKNEKMYVSYDEIKKASLEIVSAKESYILSHQDLQKIADENKTSVFNIMLFLYAYALARIFNKDGFIVNYTIADRFESKNVYLAGYTTSNVPCVLRNIKSSSCELLLRKCVIDFEEAFKHYKMADVLSNAQFTISYLTKTVKLPEWKNLESEVYPIESEVSCKDTSYSLMCMENEQGDITINIIADRDIYRKNFNDKVIRTMKEVFDELRNIDHTRLPLTATQQYYLHKEYPDNPGAFNIGNGLHIKGEADVGRMKAAIEKLYDRYDAFRLVFHLKDGGYFVLKDNVNIKIPVYEAKGATHEEQLKYAREKSCRMVTEPIMLSKDGMARFWIIKIGLDELVVGYSINHLVSDGMSFALMEETLSKLYEDPDREDMTLPNSFAEFLKEKKEALFRDTSLKSREYWRKRMIEYKDPIIIEPKVKEKEALSMVYAKIEVDRSKISVIANKSKTSNFHVIYEMWHIALAEVMKQNDIALRYAFSGRINKKDMDLFGLVAHGVTMRSNYHRDDNWKSIMEEHMKIYNEDMRHVAFADIVPVREFVMSYVDNTARQGRSNFGGDKFLAQFGLTSTYFTGRYLAVMVVEEESKITLYPYCDTATYGRELIMQLKATCNHYMETIYEDAMQGEWRPLSALCLDDTFILEQPMKTVSTSNYKNALDTVYELISSNLEFEGKLNEDDNFFELGGNSYKAFCIVNNLPEKYSGKLNISDFYDCNTLGDIAEILVSNRESN